MKKTLAYIGVYSLVIIGPLIAGMISGCVKQRVAPEIFDYYDYGPSGQPPVPGTYYDYEPMGTRQIKDSDDIIRSNFQALKAFIDVEHEVVTGAYTGSTDYDLSGTYGHHDEGSARVYYSSSAPASNEEGRVWMDSDTKTVRIANDSNAFTAMTTEEVVSARGSAGDLDTRLDVQHEETGAIKGPLDMNDTKITELATPTAGTDAANKSYVLSMIAGGGSSHAATHIDGTDNIMGGIYPVIQYTTGSTTDGIQEAIDAANAAGGGMVWIAAGDYTCDNDITLYSNIIIAGDGWDTIVASSSSTDVDFDIAGDWINDADIESTATINQNIVDVSTTALAALFLDDDVVILEDSSAAIANSFYIVTDQDATTGTVTLHSKLLRDYSGTGTIARHDGLGINVEIKDIYFKNIRIEVVKTRNLTVRNCRIDDADGYAITLDQTYKGLLDNIYIYKTGTGGIYVNRSQDVTIRNCRISRQDDSGINYQQSWRGIITNNTIGEGVDQNRGIYLQQTDLSVVSGNYCEAVLDAIWLNSTSDSNSVVGNICPYGVIDNDGDWNRGGANVYITCEGCDQPSSW